MYPFSPYVLSQEGIGLLFTAGHTTAIRIPNIETTVTLFFDFHLSAVLHPKTIDHLVIFFLIG
jgi:hypothetical protein